MEFKREYSNGPLVARAYDADGLIVEIVKLPLGKFELIIHNRRGDSDCWDDCSAELPSKWFAEIAATLAKEEG